MARWKVWNRHPNGFTHKEKFRDAMIEIPAGQFILMDYEDATQFRGQFFSMKVDPMGQPDPTGFKCIFIEPHDEPKEAETPKAFICHLDGKVFAQEKDLIDYVKTHYADQAITDETAETEMKARRGRPPKEASVG